MGGAAGVARGVMVGFRRLAASGVPVALAPIGFTTVIRTQQGATRSPARMPSGNRALNASTTAGNGSAEDNQSGGEANQAGGQGNQSGGEEPLSHRDSQPGVPCLVALPPSPRLRLRALGPAPEP